MKLLPRPELDMPWWRTESGLWVPRLADAWSSGCAAGCGVGSGEDEWTPAQLPGLLAWYDTSDAYQTSAVQPTSDDWDMETAGVARWPALAAATRTKEAGGVSGNCLRCAYNGTDAFGSYQTGKLITGNRYRMTGYGRGDGAGALPVPKIEDGSLVIWTGTNSNTWQAFNLERTFPGTTFYLYCASGGAGYVEWDQIAFTNLSRTALVARAGSLGDTLSQATATLQPWRTTMANRSCLRGAGDRLVSGLPASSWKCLHDGTGMIFSAVVAPMDNTKTNAFIGTVTTYGLATQVGWSAMFYTGKPYFRVHNGTSLIVDTSHAGVLSEGNPHHILCLYKEGRSPKEAEMWIDGVLLGSQNSTGAPSASDPYQTLDIFGHTSGDAYVKMADVVLCNQVSDASVAKLIAYEKARWGIV